MHVADYDSPVAENGDLTEKYFIIQRVLRETLQQSDGLLCDVGFCLFICLPHVLAVVFENLLSI